jgi:hypothetical protein
MTRKYAIKYNVEFDTNEGKGFTKEEILESGMGGADAYFFASILYDEDGVSYHFLGSNGKTQEALDHLEIFKMWASLASALTNTELPETHRKIANETLENIRKSFNLGCGGDKK